MGRRRGTRRASAWQCCSPRAMLAGTGIAAWHWAAAAGLCRDGRAPPGRRAGTARCRPEGHCDARRSRPSLDGVVLPFAGNGDVIDASDAAREHLRARAGSAGGLRTVRHGCILPIGSAISARWPTCATAQRAPDRRTAHPPAAEQRALPRPTAMATSPWN